MMDLNKLACRRVALNLSIVGFVNATFFLPGIYIPSIRQIMQILGYVQAFYLIFQYLIQAGKWDHVLICKVLSVSKLTVEQTEVTNQRLVAGTIALCNTTGTWRSLTPASN